MDILKVVSSAKLSEGHQNDLKNSYNRLDFHFYENIEDAKQELKTAEILITYGEDLNTDIINSCEKLRWIQIISAGIDKIPFKAIEEKKIIVTNAKGIHRIPMSEYTISAILQLARKSHEIYKNQLDKKWDRSIRTFEISNQILGIIGLGAIGQGIAEKAKAFNMRVIGVNTDGRAVENVDRVYPLEELNVLLSESDFIVVVIPLTKDTYHLIGADELKYIKETAYLINIARGEIIDESALIESLRNKNFAGAVLDVFTEEPLPVEHPLWSLDNCIITPHLSGRSPKYIKRALEIFKYNMNFYLMQDALNMKNVIDLNKEY